MFSRRDKRTNTLHRPPIPYIPLDPPQDRHLPLPPRHIPELGISPVGTTTSAPQKTSSPSAYSSPSHQCSHGTSNKQGHRHGVTIWACNGMSDPCLQHTGAGGAGPALSEALLSPSSPIPLTAALRMGSCSQTPLPTSLWLQVPLA